MKRMRVSLQASFVVGAVLSVIAQALHSEDYFNATPVAVNRRSLDVRIILQEDNTRSSNINCNDDNATYLVKENQCINNQHLFDGNEECMTVL